MTWHNIDEWTQYFQDAGLNIIDKNVSAEKIHYPSALDLMRSIHLTGTVSPQKTSPRLLLKSVREYSEKFKSPEGVYATWKFAQIEASL